MDTKIKKEKKDRRKKRIRAKISGSASVPRLSVFRSNKYIYAQLIDDSSQKTIVSADSKKMKGTSKENAVLVGNMVAEKAIEKNIKKVVFDRNGYVYKGSIALLADGARAKGLTF